MADEDATTYGARTVAAPDVLDPPVIERLTRILATALPAK